MSRRLPFHLFVYLCRKTNILDNMIYMMEKYTDNLEELVLERTGQLIDEKRKTDALLERMLPSYVSFKLCCKPKCTAY